MFRTLRKVLLGLSVLILCGFGYHFLGNPDYRRSIAQTAVELKEDTTARKTYSWSGTAVVREITEGDALVVSIDQRPRLSVRLAGVSAPVLVNRVHKPQPLAQESRDFLACMLQDKAVQMDIVGSDAQQRPLVLLSLDGGLVNAKVVSAGQAEYARQNADLIPARLRHEIENAEFRARAGRLGIWGITNHTPVEEYRIRYP